MTDSYTWEWILPAVALQTVLRPMKLAETEQMEASLPQRLATGPGAGRNWGLVLDLRNAGVADDAVQEVIKRLMRTGEEAGCTAVAMVVTKTVVEMQIKRLGHEAAKTSVVVFESVDDAIASVKSRLTTAA